MHSERGATLAPHLNWDGHHAEANGEDDDGSAQHCLGHHIAEADSGQRGDDLVGMISRRVAVWIAAAA